MWLYSTKQLANYRKLIDHTLVHGPQVLSGSVYLALLYTQPLLCRATQLTVSQFVDSRALISGKTLTLTVLLA